MGWGSLIEILVAAGRWILLLLASQLPRIMAGVFFAFGMNLVVQKFLMPDVKGAIASRMSGVPQVVMQVFTMLHVQQAVTIILSAIAIVITGRIAVRKIGT